MGIITFVRYLSFSHLLQLGILLLWLPLIGCGSGSSGDGGGEGPTIDISFPLPNSNLVGETDRITLRGRAVAKDGAKLNQVLINNRTLQNAVNAKPPADLPDGDSPMVQFDQADGSRWSTKIALLRQTNDILIEASDDRGHTREVKLVVRNAPTFIEPNDLVLDSDNNRVLVVDSRVGVLLAVDLASGEISLISGLSTGTGPSLGKAIAVALDNANNRALVVNQRLGVLLGVDLDSGDRTVISNEAMGEGPAFNYPVAVALDSTNKRALVLDGVSNQNASGLRALLGVDLDSGMRTVISNEAMGGGPAFVNPIDFALDSAGNRALVVDAGLDALLGVNLDNGDRTVISDASIGGGPEFVNPVAIALNSAEHRALVVDGGTSESREALFEVDLESGVRTLISDRTIGGGPVFIDPVPVAFDSVNKRALVVDTLLDALFAVDLANGNRTVIAKEPTGAGPVLITLAGVSLDMANNRALVVDGEFGLNALLVVNLDNGDRTVISNATLGGGPAFDVPTAVALDSVNNRALLVDEGLDALLAVNLDSGMRTVISNEARGGGPAFVNPVNVALDSASNRALVVDAGLDALLRVNLDSGDRTVISDASMGGGPAFDVPTAVALDSVNNRALLVDEGLDALVAVNLDSGMRTVISNEAMGGGDVDMFLRPVAIALDSANNRALVMDFGWVALLAVDLASGNRTVVSDVDSGTGAGPTFNGPDDIALDSANDRILVVDWGLDALLAVDLGSGDRVIVSK